MRDSVRSMREGGGPRVVVVGAGVAGLSAAMHLGRLGAEVTVLEKSTLASGSSGLSAGIFNRQTIDPVDLQLRVESGRQFDSLESTSGAFSVVRCGYLRVVRTEEQWRAVEAVVLNDHPDTRLISPADVAALVPGMRVDDVWGAMYGARDGCIDGPELCAAYLEQAELHGVTYRPGVEVLGHRRRPGGLVIESDSGEFEADVVVNAAGSWAQTVGERLGAPVVIDNQRHGVALVSVPSLRERDVPTVQTYFPGSGEDAVYIRPEGAGRFLAGMHSYEATGEPADPERPSPKPDGEQIEVLAEALVDRFPAWEDAGIQSGWSGIYPLSGDGRFVVGPHRSNPHVVTVGGLGGVGLTVSPAVGLLTAEWVVYGEARTFDFGSDLLPDRPRVEASA